MQMTGLQHHFFERTADRLPDGVAVDDHGDGTTYRALELRANRIAHLLRAHGCAPNARVAIFTEKSADQYAAVLGALKAGGCWVPLSGAFPAARLKALVETLQPCVIVTDPANLNAALVARVEGGSTAPVLVLGGEDALEAGILGEASLASQSDQRISETQVTPEDLAYIIFTSGSTGSPKGVMVRHRNTCSFLDLCPDFFGIAPGARFAHFADLTFDPSVFDLFHAWATGGTVVPANRRSYRINPAKFLQQADINVLFCVPSVIASVDEAGHLDDVALGSVTHLLLTGEGLPPALVRRWYEVHPKGNVYNMYGTTETAIVSHWFAIPRDMDGVAPIPVGRPLPGMRVRLLVDAEAVASGQAGESVVSGPQVSPGYWNNDYMTARAFGPDPEMPDVPVITYRTGDLLRADDTGLHHFVGRRDDQHKVRGHRVELGEIEAVLARIEGVGEAAVVAVSGDRAADTRLIAFVRTEPERAIEGLRSIAAAELPVYMVPSAILPVLGDFPRNRNGKIDRQALLRLATDSLTRKAS